MKLLETWYNQQTINGKLIFDGAQLRILQQLDLFITNFNKSGLFNRLFTKPTTLGYYIYGSVGRGKSMIVNELYRQINTSQKIRLHFHEFMHDIHQKLANLKNEAHSLNSIAKGLRQKYRIIFLDEMHISDIATAMILKNLLSALFAHGIFLITSSNYKPDDLYPNGLMRERFLPAIKLINQKLTILSLDSPNDYRLTHSSFNQLFFINQINPQNKLNEIFNQISKNNIYHEPGSITIQSRAFQFIKKSDEIIWLDFNYVCGNKRSQLDYLELMHKFKWFIIDNVYALAAAQKDIARRFTWLIDILYDNQRKLVLVSSSKLAEIYQDGDFANEFTRTISRLMEMQTKEYLALR